MQTIILNTLRFFIVMAVLISAIPVAQSQASYRHTLTLEEVFSLADERSKTIKIYETAVEVARVLAVCEALQSGDYETVGKKMYETHAGLSDDYEVSCEELDFLNDVAKECRVTGSRIMGGGFGESHFV